MTNFCFLSLLLSLMNTEPLAPRMVRILVEGRAMHSGGAHVKAAGSVGSGDGAGKQPHTCILTLLILLRDLVWMDTAFSQHLPVERRGRTSLELMVWGRIRLCLDTLHQVRDLVGGQDLAQGPCPSATYRA